MSMQSKGTPAKLETMRIRAWGLQAKPQFDAVAKRRLVATFNCATVSAGFESDLWTNRWVSDSIGKTGDYGSIPTMWMHSAHAGLPCPEARVSE